MQGRPVETISLTLLRVLKSDPNLHFKINFNP